MNLIVALTGKSGSGKTTVAQELARAGFQSRSFGDHLRQVAAQRGVGQDADNLRALGEELIATLGWRRLCLEVLGGTDLRGGVVVDGVRHLGASASLTQIAGAGRFVLVCLKVPESLRLMRLAARGRSGDSSAYQKTDGDLDVLERSADLIVDSSQSPVAEILAFVHRLP